ncbi:SAC3/GANP/THP3, conserved domain [Dillenia turbinata]|uniref:SAC3/GANP/THP3, conserved domain n=1 Tax=Dillenia turbinata TaxID=194707 RepID=A0AAN8V1A8_9MAGN
MEKGFIQRQRQRPSSSSSSSRSHPRKERGHFNPNCLNRSKSLDSAPTQGQGQGQDQGLEETSCITGTCPDMCPAKERAQRERLRDLAVFERLNGHPAKTSSHLAVKKFCRTISVKQVHASDVRPLPVLEMTLNHLLSLLSSTGHPFEVVHDFIFDRTRSIRQDLGLQNIVDHKAVHMYEEMVKFHVISHHKLQSHGNDPDISSMQYLNHEQLTKALLSLYDMYDRTQKFESRFINEAEYRSLYVLLHLGFRSQQIGESLSLWFCQLPLPIIKTKEICFARNLLRYFQMGNYKRFFCTIAAEASHLQYCIIAPYVNEVRAQAVSIINHGGYKLNPYPLGHLSNLLMLTESDMESFCRACGLEIHIDDAGNKFLPTKQSTFCHPKGGFQNYSFLGLEHFER